jgi:hypothetical protein
VAQRVWLRQNLCIGISPHCGNAQDADLAVTIEKIIAHAAVIRPLTAVRSTLIQSSINSLKVAGHFDRYVQLLDPLHREVVLNTLAPTWLPLEAGMAHYGACDALNLDARQMRDVAERVGDRIQGTFLKALTRGARAAGITPWTLLNHFDRIWGRLFQGGSVEVTREGPKDVTIDMRSAVIPRFEYVRVGFTGLFRGGFKFVGVANPHINIVQWNERKDEFTVHAAWV